MKQMGTQMKWGDRLIKYCNMVTMGRNIIARTREYGNYDLYNIILWYVNGGKN